METLTSQDDQEEEARERWRRGRHTDAGGHCQSCTEYFGVSWLCAAARGAR